MPEPSSNRDIVVIGASAGGVDALRELLAGLPAGLPASLFVVVHIGASSRLADVLERTSVLPVVRAETGMFVRPGHVYVAQPGKHLLLHDDHILLRRGPRENLSRPAIDPLFRSAAATFGGRVIGVVLSGALSDGTGGRPARHQALRWPRGRAGAGGCLRADHALQCPAPRRRRSRRTDPQHGFVVERAGA